MITNSWYCSFITSFERKKIELKLPTPFCFLSFVFFSLIVLSVSNSHLIAVNCKIQKATGTFFYIKLADKSRLRGKIVCPINSLNALFQLSIKLIKQSQVTGIEIMILVNICLVQLFIFYQWINNNQPGLSLISCVILWSQAKVDEMSQFFCAYNLFFYQFGIIFISRYYVYWGCLSTLKL